MKKKNKKNITSNEKNKTQYQNKFWSRFGIYFLYILLIILLLFPWLMGIYTFIKSYKSE